MEGGEGIMGNEGDGSTGSGVESEGLPFGLWGARKTRERERGEEKETKNEVERQERRERE